MPGVLMNVKSGPAFLLLIGNGTFFVPVIENGLGKSKPKADHFGLF
jgi:hypothetical protein